MATWIDQGTTASCAQNAKYSIRFKLFKTTIVLPVVSVKPTRKFWLYGYGAKKVTSAVSSFRKFVWGG